MINNPKDLNKSLDLDKPLLKEKKPRVKELSLAQKKRRNQLNKFFNKYFNFFILLAVLIIFALSFYFLIKPKYQKIIESINTTFLEKNQLMPKYQELKEYQALAEAYKQVKPEEVEKIKGLIPEEYTKEELFTELIYLVSQQGLTVDSVDINPGEAVMAAATGRRPGEDSPASPSLASGRLGQMKAIIMTSNTTYPELKTLIAAIEKSLRLIDIDKLSYDPAGLTASLEITTYYFKK